MSSITSEREAMGAVMMRRWPSAFVTVSREPDRESAVAAGAPLPSV